VPCGREYNAENSFRSDDIWEIIKLRRLGWAGHVSRVGEMRYVYKIVVGKPKRKRPLRRTRCRWENNIKMDLKEIQRKDSADLEYGLVAGFYEHGNLFSDFIKAVIFLTSRGNTRLSRILVHGVT
jgi:hypothetical protein